MIPPRTALVIGAGPAGLTAAHELCHRTNIRPLVLEADGVMGGISRTVVHHGNRIDIGGHRFFSRSDRVMDWWLARMPLQRVGAAASLSYQGAARGIAATEGPDPATTERVMLLRPRRSRIFHRGRLFDYPLRLTPDTIRKLGLRHTARVGLSFAHARLRPRPEQSLEDFLVNRFGRELYRTFFQEYTEKVWGVPCTEISAEWGAQRIKGLDLQKALGHFLTRLIPGAPRDLAQKDTETSLIDQFLYPRLGPGQMWEVVAEEIRAAGGKIQTGWKVVEILVDGQGRRATGVVAVDRQGIRRRFDADLVISTMPVQQLVRGLGANTTVPEAVRATAKGLRYRDFVTVGLLVDQLAIHDKGAPVKDNWIYIQEPGVHMGRMQIFNNWSPWMVADPSKTWIGLEYFCNQGDVLWSRTDEELGRLGIEEAARIGIIDPGLVRDQVVIRMEKTYPAYFGTYGSFEGLRAWLDEIEGLYLIGRNGMHRYNNQDHSMLTAMTVVDGLVAGTVDKAAVWAVNTEESYHEERDQR